MLLSYVLADIYDFFSNLTTFGGHFGDHFGGHLGRQLGFKE